jgi:hypothetical protein
MPAALRPALLSTIILAVGACGDDPLDIEDPDLLNGSWVGTSVVTLYDPDTGDAVCTDSASATTVTLSSTSNADVGATVSFDPCSGRAVAGGTWVAGDCRYGEGPVGKSIACSYLDPAAAILNTVVLKWWVDGSPTTLAWAYNEPKSTGGGPTQAAEAEGELRRP